jgi:uncharacterized protein (DUF427 family)
LSARPAGTFSLPVPDGVSYIEPFRRRVRGLAGEGTVVDSERVVLVHRPGSPPAFAFPAEDVAADTELAGPLPEVPGYVQVAGSAVEAWYEEGQRIYANYPRNPYHRVDCIPTSRRLRVEVAGTVLVDTTETLGVYETALEPRLYVSPERVRRDLLVASRTTTYCGYKGTAWYWSAVVDDVIVEDVAWSYEDPLPEFLPGGRFLSFDEARVTVEAEIPPAAELPSRQP